ncbi:MAG: inositol monophosphatase family protein [Candidatus Marinimicrobia bacterium]|nr:inositol monophosphatase family protein [Candidatus Neomarinimicrobiota bacterium]MDD5583043.1 inositol monophosphatase family protein [Candidatus Neomarinimicrobiota bacterium]
MSDTQFFGRKAREWIVAAGNLVMKGREESYRFTMKEKTNPVTEIDIRCEQFLKAKILSQFPDHNILAEESAPIENTSEVTWIIDPIDGTTNFLHNFPYFCISIAIQTKAGVIAGVIYDPLRQELFYSDAETEGTILNDKPVHVTTTKKVQDSLLVTGFPYKHDEIFYQNFKRFQRMYERSHGVRRSGAAALDLAYVASGRSDGYWEFTLKPWDCAAGAYLVMKAGGHVTTVEGQNYSPYIPSLLASNGYIHAEMIEILNLNNNT